MPLHRQGRACATSWAALVLVVIGFAALAPAASATLRVTSSADGLVLTDANGTFDDDVQLNLVSAAQGLEWKIEKTNICGRPGGPQGPCVDLIRYELGRGSPCRVEEDAVFCPRTAPRVTVNLLGGNDVFVAHFDTVGDPVTVNLGDGDDSVFGGSGPDTLDGGAGNDFIAGNQGNDVLTGSAGNDILKPAEGADVADGGLGDDRVELDTPARDETDQVNGGAGRDTVSYTNLSVFGVDVGRGTPVRIIDANLQSLGGDKDTPESDVLNAFEVYVGGLGNDIITGVLASIPSAYDGGVGNDALFGTSGANTLTGGGGADTLSGKDGNDLLDGKTGEGKVAVGDPEIDCGLGTADFAILDLKDDLTPTGCENINRSAILEGPHVQPAIEKLARVRDGGVTVRLSCPATLTKRCVGSLHVRFGTARTPATDYSISRGRSSRVTVDLGARERLVGARTVARLVSLEDGLHGLKTTTRRLVLTRQGSR
jgi:Ca2+-binding RTX toxin-like protein